MKTSKKGHMLSHVESAASSAVKTALDIGASAILVLSDTGETCRFVSKFHPNQLVLATYPNGRAGALRPLQRQQAASVPTMGADGTADQSLARRQSKSSRRAQTASGARPDM